ncbi:MAG TPA: class I SAM-dependent methyltransferase [Jatrophihabitantaceae bacterium]
MGEDGAEADPAAGWDRWYSNMAGDRAPRDELPQRHLGLPPYLKSTSLLTWDGIAEVVDALRLHPGDRLLDLACGRGGYGLEIARRTRARLHGVDISAEAIRQATENAQQLGGAAEFSVGTFAATGRPTASADAIVAVDAIQFAPEAESFEEVRRVLVPGGRVVLTTWEARDRSDDRISERHLQTDTQARLTEAGFADVRVVERFEWRTAERRLWEDAVALDPGDDPDLQDLQEEAQRILPTFDLTRRVLATATAPTT